MQEEDIQEEDIREEIAALALVALAEYPVFLEIKDLGMRDRSALRETSFLLLYTALALEKESEVEKLEEDPRILLPLLRSLADAYALLFLGDPEDWTLGALPDGDEIAHLLKEDVIDFLARFGGERAEEVLSRAQ